MSEKRFFNSYFTEHIIDKLTDKCYPVRYVEGVYELTDLLNELSDENGQLEEENEQLKHWNKCLAEKRHNEKKDNERLYKKLISKIDFLERIIEGDV